MRTGGGGQVGHREGRGAAAQERERADLGPANGLERKMPLVPTEEWTVAPVTAGRSFGRDSGRQALGKVRSESAESLGEDSLGRVMPSCAVTCVMGPVCRRFGTGVTLVLW